VTALPLSVWRSASGGWSGRFPLARVCLPWQRARRRMRLRLDLGRRPHALPRFDGPSRKAWPVGCVDACLPAARRRPTVACVRLGPLVASTAFSPTGTDRPNGGDDRRALRGRFRSRASEPAGTRPSSVRFGIPFDRLVSRVSRKSFEIIRRLLAGAEGGVSFEGPDFNGWGRRRADAAPGRARFPMMIGTFGGRRMLEITLPARPETWNAWYSVGTATRPPGFRGSWPQAC